MDNTKIRNYQIASAIFVCILGTLLHFTYKFFGENNFVASFSAVNESVWEHLKLLFFPMLLTTIIGYFYIGKNAPNFLCSKTLGIITSMLFIIIFFYTYTGIIGKSILFIDITSFFVAVILGEYLSYKLMITNFECNNIIAIIILTIILICFVVFTYFPPNIELFKDPVTNQYGIIKI
ncbi:MAG: sodium/proton-translocating pyrophosphatase [Clostridia bacterium]|nr:sodium/proton-translocating pyrophosphatase [Clostridia bacterium]